MYKIRELVTADIHGNYKAFKQVLQLSRFDYDADLLICLGDTADGYPDIVECFDELLKIKNLIYIMGNHDFWLYEWLKFGASPLIWTEQGGRATLKSYIERAEQDGLETQKKHLRLLERAKDYYLDDKNRLFVHGGFDWHTPIEDNEPYFLRWDRHAYATAHMWDTKKEDNHFKDYKEVYVGHTATNYSYHNQRISTIPLQLTNLWAMDQGAGYRGKLSLMDINTKEYWQSDNADILYPKDKGRF